jgi:hypothetical protein
VKSVEGSEDQKEKTMMRGRSKQPKDDEGRPSDIPKVGMTGKGIRASREIRLGLRSKDLRFGVWSQGAPTWSWFVGASGSVEWIVGDMDFPMQNARDPKFVNSKEADLPWSGEVDT